MYTRDSTVIQLIEVMCLLSTTLFDRRIQKGTQLLDLKNNVHMNHQIRTKNSTLTRLVGSLRAFQTDNITII